jgi:nucleoside-diphosphate-sugar epimerase
VPVVVTGADTPLGRLVMARLVGQGLDLRATVDSREAVGPLVAHRVKTAVSDLHDTERFGGVVEGAHTVIHLRGVSSGAMLAGVPDVLAALPDSGVERIVTLAGLGLGRHPALDQLRASGLDVVVLRVGVVLAPLSDPEAGRPNVTPRTRQVAPLYVDDLADALVAADHLRELHGYVEVDAVGNDVVTSRELDQLLGTRRGPFDRWTSRRVHSGVAAYGPKGPNEVHLVGDRGAALERVLGVRPMSLADAVAAVTAVTSP